MTARLLLFACLLASVSVARAQSANPQAEELFRQGRELMTAGKFADACTAFEASEKLDHAVTTLINLGVCREKNGQLATAWATYLDAERASRPASDDAGKKLHQVALDHANKLEPRVSKLTVSVPAESKVDRLEIRRDDVALAEGSWNRALPIDGGTYHVTAKAPGTTEWSATITIAVEGDSKTVDVPRLSAVAAPPPPPPPPRSKLVSLALGGAAVVSLGAALAFDLSGDSTYNKAKLEVDPTKQDALWHSANDKRHAALAFTGVGVACAGVATWLWLRATGERHAPAVTIAPTTNGVVVTGSWR